MRVAEELVSREKVDVLMPARFLSNTGLALTDFAKQKKVFFLAGEPLTDKIIWQNGNHYTFRLRPSTYMQVGDAGARGGQAEEEALGHRLPELRIRPVGRGDLQEAAEGSAARRRVRRRAGAAARQGRRRRVVQALADAKPDAIFNVLFGADLSKFVREGNTRGLFKGREVVSLLTGEPEYLDPLKDEAPNGWIVTGYPWYGIQTPEHKAFFLAYTASSRTTRASARWSATATIKSIAAGIKKAEVDRHREAGRRVQRPAGR